MQAVAALQTQRRMSHVFRLEVPAYPKPLLVTDAAINIQPSLPEKAERRARIPMGRMGEGGDIGAAVAYLASRDAGYVTGQTLHVNGGMAMI
mgnify:CR=1 FL=1